MHPLHTASGTTGVPSNWWQHASHVQGPELDWQLGFTALHLLFTHQPHKSPQYDAQHASHVLQVPVEGSAHTFFCGGAASAIAVDSVIRRPRAPAAGAA